MEVFGDTATYTLKKSTDYFVSVVNQESGYLMATPYTSDSKGLLTIDLIDEVTGNYDYWVSVEIVEGTTALGGPVVLLDSVTKVRPYATATEAIVYMGGKITQPQALEYERFARALINNIIGTPFSFNRKTVLVNGNGTDHLLFDERVGKVFNVWENGELVWSVDMVDSPLLYSRGNNPYNVIVTDLNDGEVNRMEHVNTWSTRYYYPTFKAGYDYQVDAEYGWQVVPQDIKDATLLLINDISCGNNRYANKYIKQFANGPQNLSYFDNSIRGTGNLLVDNTLEKYKMEAIRAKVL
jgi:hypothetical protein